MKMKWCVKCFLMLVLCAGSQLHAQQTDSARSIFERIMAKAENGDAGSQCSIAEYYGFGKLLGVTNELGEVVEWTKDEKEAVKWFYKSAEQGYAEAQFDLGVCFRDSIGVKQNYAEALKWFRKAADQGFASAQLNLGSLYADGQGVPENYVEAINWYRKAAAQGLTAAQYDIGVCYANGEGVVKDEVEAVKWYRKAAEQGNDAAQHNLGVAYFNGKGLPKDYVEAYKWNNLASAQGNEYARKSMPIIERGMTPEQIAEAQRRSAEFVPKQEIQSSSSDNFNSFENPTIIGTGFFITDDGYLITNNHVVKDATKIRLVTSVGMIDAKVVHVDAANDLALLKAIGKFSPLPIAASRSAHLGGTVATIGFPDPSLQGFSPKLAKGEIASLSGASDDPRYFQISVPVQPGNSGGALVDERGNVIGIVSAKLDASAALAMSGSLPENVNYAVKSSLLLSFLESVPEVADKLKQPNTADEKFKDVVKSAQDAAVLVLVY
jgi:uncharacterized protein